VIPESDDLGGATIVLVLNLVVIVLHGYNFFCTLGWIRKRDSTYVEEFDVKLMQRIGLLSAGRVVFVLFEVFGLLHRTPLFFYWPLRELPTYAYWRNLLAILELWGLSTLPQLRGQANASPLLSRILSILSVSLKVFFSCYVGLRIYPSLAEWLLWAISMGIYPVTQDTAELWLKAAYGMGLVFLSSCLGVGFVVLLGPLVASLLYPPSPGITRQHSAMERSVSISKIRWTVFAIVSALALDLVLSLTFVLNLVTKDTTSELARTAVRLGEAIVVWSILWAYSFDASSAMERTKSR